MDNREIENINNTLNCIRATIKQMIHTLDEIDLLINKAIKIDEIDRKIDEINKKMVEIKEDINLQTKDVDENDAFGIINVGMMILFFCITLLHFIAGVCFLLFEENTVVNYDIGRIIVYIYILTVSFLFIYTLFTCLNSTKSGNELKINNYYIPLIIWVLLVIIALIPSTITTINTLLLKINGNGLNEKLISILVTTENYCDKLIAVDFMLFIINLYAIFIKGNNSKTWRYNALAIAIAVFSIMLPLR